MKKLIILIALIMIIVHSVKLIARLNGALARAMSTNERELAVTSQEEIK